MHIRFLRNTGVAGKPYKKGDTADLSDAIAKDFIRKGRAEAFTFAEGGVVIRETSPANDDTVLPSPEEKLRQVARVINCFNPDNAEYFTKDGDIRCDVLSDQCGFEVTAQMRDDAVVLLEERQREEAPDDNSSDSEKKQENEI